MANRFIKSLILLLISSYCYPNAESYIRNELLKSYVKVEIEPLNEGYISTCLGKVVEKYIRHNLNSKRLLYVEDCKVGNEIQVQRYWYSFKGFNYGFVLTEVLIKGQSIIRGQYREELVEDFGSLMLSSSNQKSLTYLPVGTVLTLGNTISNKAVLLGDEMDVLINYRSARIKTIGVALESALPGEIMKIRVNEKVLKSTLGALGVAYVN